LRIRAATRKDLDALRELVAGIPRSLASPGLTGAVALPAVEQLLLTGVVAGDRQLLLIETRKPRQVVGLLDARLHQPRPGTAFVELLLFRPSARGQGLGGEACRAWQAWLQRSRGIREVQAAVLEQDAAALTFWSGLGFRGTGERREDDTGRIYRVLALRG
jgi:RimJ/RimL family protein N-acetyltransferase